MTQGLVAINSWTFLAQMLNLLIQIVLIRKFLLKPIKEVIAKRKAISDEELAVARKSRAEAEAMKAEYESSIANAKAEANEIIQTAEKAADTRGEEIVAAAEKHAASIKAKAETDIEQERKKAVNELKNEIGGIAVDLAGKVIEREISEKDHQALINEFIENVGEAS